MGCVCTDGVVVCFWSGGSIGVEGETALCVLVSVRRGGCVWDFSVDPGCVCGETALCVYMDRDTWVCVEGDTE